MKMHKFKWKDRTKYAKLLFGSSDTQSVKSNGSKKGAVRPKVNPKHKQMRLKTLREHGINV